MLLLLFFSPTTAIIQKRLKKEKKAKRKLQEALEFETKRREQAEQALKQAASTDNLRVLNGKMMAFFSIWLMLGSSGFVERTTATLSAGWKNKSCFLFGEMMLRFTC